MKTRLLNSLKVVILLLIPALNYAQAPALGSAANFVLFTSVGAVTNSGIPYLTKITGNVGTNSAPTITGFGNINGQMHYVSDPVSTACTADLLLASNSLLAAIPDSTIGVVFGNGQTIRPGIFLIPGVGSLNLTLTLDGKGNSGSVFIFKTTLAFSTSANAKIRLINGAQACNVFWSIGGAVNMGAGTTMRGTIISGGAISIGIGDTLEGRALSTTGAILTSQVLGYMPAGCGSPVLTGPAAPALASTAGYAVFSSIGSVTDDGTSHITGDVGTNSGLTTGYNPLFVTGMIHPSPDASTAACAADLINVYNYLNLHAYDINLLFPAQFGHNLVLTPHTYLLDAATLLTDTVYLDARGNDNAVFIIQVNGALSTTTHSKVVLINGTQSKNVYWKVSGAVNIMDYSAFKGTIVAAGAITFGIGASLDGRAFTTVGAITTTGLFANIPAINFTEPTNQTSCVGGSASFTVAIAATAPTYQWRRGTLSIIEGGNFSGTNSPTLTISPVTLSDAATNYNVLIAGSVVPSVNSTSVSLTVNPLPLPTIAGPALVCINSTGIIYSTQASMTGYTWTISPGGTITSGAGTSAISVTWSTIGVKTVTVNYTNLSNCAGATPASYPVTVTALPVPTITGAITACYGATGLVYSTQTGMAAYIWTVSAGGTITSGAGTNAITITWSTIGAQTVTVNYTNASNCAAVTPASIAVTVNALPVPTIGSTNDPCTGSTNNIYYTESGMNGYVWTVSNGGTIVSGQGTVTLNVTWSQLGLQTVNVNYSNAAGCQAASPTVYTLFVNSPPNAAGAITGTASVCAGITGVIYSTIPVVGATTYSWTVPSGAMIASGAGTTIITVDFGTSAVSGNVSVAGNNQCGNGASSSFAVAVNPVPAGAGTITGPASVCAGTTDVAYSIATIANASAYVWSVPEGATITSGATTKNIVVSFGPAAGSGIITVNGTNTCGSGVVSPDLTILMNAIPATPVVTVTGDLLTSSASTGNQWYYNNTLIPGATSQTYTVTNNTGNYWCAVTLTGCPSEISNKIWIEIVGTTELAASTSFRIYPVPNNGQFNASIRYPVDGTFTIMVYTQLGEKLFEFRDVRIAGGKFEKQIDLRPVTNGIYFIAFRNSQFNIVKKFFIQN